MRCITGPVLSIWQKFDKSMTFEHAVCFHLRMKLFWIVGANISSIFLYFTEMLTICKACNSQGGGMISIFHHPNGVDKMYTFVSGIEDVSSAEHLLQKKISQKQHWHCAIFVKKQIREDDAICIPCYDDLKIAHNFKQKCIQSHLLQKSDTKTATNCGRQLKIVCVWFGLIERKKRRSLFQTKGGNRSTDQSSSMSPQRPSQSKLKWRRLHRVRLR